MCSAFEIRFRPSQEEKAKQQLNFFSISQLNVRLVLERIGEAATNRPAPLLDC